MATVPYDPIPKATPEVAPTRPLRIDANANMFGANIGAALDSAGHDVAGVGAQLYQTAMNFRKLDIENNINKELTAADQESGDLINKFHLLEGKDPQEQLDGFKTTLESVRKSHRDNLGTDYEKQQYDRATMRDFGHSVVNAGLYAAQQRRGFDRDERSAKTKMATDKLGDSPNDPAIVQQKFKDIEDSVTLQMQGTGMAPDKLIEHQRDVLTAAVQRTAESLKNPDQAEAFVKLAKGKIWDVGYNTIMKGVLDRGVESRAETESNKISNPAGPLLERARATTKKQESGNYTNVTTTINQKTGLPQSALGAYGIMESNLKDWGMQTFGRSDITRQEFLANPQLQDMMYDKIMGGYIKKYGVEGAGRAWIGGEGAVTGDQNIADALGTKRGVYGRTFAAGVGAYDPNAMTEYGRLQMHDAARIRAQQLYPDDQERRERFIDRTIAHIDTQRSVQKGELDQHVKQLSDSIKSTMETKQPDAQGQGGWMPRSPEEARKVNPQFDAVVDEIDKYRPGYKAGLDAWYRRNASEELPYTKERKNAYLHTVGLSDEEVMKLKPYEMSDRAEIQHADADKIRLRQEQIHKRSEVDDRIEQVMSRHEELRNAMEAYPSRNNEKANSRYTWLKGVMHDEMQRFVDRTGAQMSRADEEKMWEEHSQQVVTGQHDSYGGLGHLFGAKPIEEKDYEFVKAYKDMEARKATEARDKPKSVSTVTQRIVNGRILRQSDPNGPVEDIGPAPGQNASPVTTVPAPALPPNAITPPVVPPSR